MERPIDFDIALKLAVVQERRHLIDPVENYDKAKANAEYIGKRIMGFYTTQTTKDIENYLFLVRNPQILEGYSNTPEAREKFPKLRQLAITGFSLCILLREIVPKTDGISEWTELEKVNALANRLSSALDYQSENMSLEEVKQKDKELTDLIFCR